MVLSSLVATVTLAPALAGGQGSDRHTRDLLPVGSVAPSFSLTGVRGGTAASPPKRSSRS